MTGFSPASFSCTHVCIFVSLSLFYILVLCTLISISDREKVGLETGDNKDVVELDRGKHKRPRGARESLVPSPIFTETGVVCLKSESSAEDVTMWWEAPESMIKMPGTELLILGTVAEMNADASSRS